jgi:phosphonate transport system ATP-binding protein
LEVWPGAITMMLGRSGCGKTTLLKILHGLLTPQRGSVEPCPGVETVAYIPQTLGLVRSLSAEENVLTGALRRMGAWRSLLKAFPSPLRQEARALLADLGLAAKIEERVGRLSGGERQRVAIARALMQRPQLVLADECVSQLDPVTAREILRLMRRSAEGGVGWLVATHDLELVSDYADRVAIMQAGRIIVERTIGPDGIGDLADWL